MSLNPQARLRTSGLVELTWTPDLTCFGYRFYRDGIPVAKSTKPGQKMTTFAAETDGQSHFYGVARALEQIMESVLFPVVTPPPSGNKYASTTLSNPKTVVVTNADLRAAYNLDVNSDYIIRVGEVLHGTVVITGGRDLNLIGGEWNIDGAGTSSYWDHGGIAIQGGAPGSTVHVEGVHVHGATLNDAIVWACPDRHLRFQTILVGPNTAFADYHPDGFQNQGGCASLKMDKVTVYTELQGLFFGDHSGLMGPTWVDRVNIVGSPGRYLFWKSKPQASDVTFADDCYLDAPNDTLGPSIGRWVYPNELAQPVYSWSLPTEKAVVSDNGNYVSWTGCPRISGGFHKGRPPGGDYVLPHTVGLQHV
jgi:hypothetical protein